MSVQRSSWFVRPPNIDTAHLRLYCFPYAGGGTWIFRRWPELLGDTIAVCPIKLPGRADRFSEPPATDMHALAETLAHHLGPLIHEPYVLLGYSMGALLAFECACRLRNIGAPHPVRLVVVAAPAPSRVDIPRPLHRLPDKAFMTAVQSRYENPMATDIDDETLPLVLPALRGDMTMYETYRARPDTPPLACPISAIGGRQDSVVSEMDIQAWDDHGAVAFTAHMLPGGHFLIHEQETALAARVRAELEQDVIDLNPVT